MSDKITPVAEKQAQESSSQNSLKDEENGQTGDLKRTLEARHLQMIAIGGTIGTGLFIGSGAAIAEAGPVGALIGFASVGVLVYSVMQSFAEMGTHLPVTGAFTSYATRFVDPSLGFAMGWIYWFSWACTFALELTAVGIIIHYWKPDVSDAMLITIFLVAITAANLLPVKFYGEFEFWLSMVKVITIVGFIIFAICIDAGAGKNGYLGFSTWKNPGPFAPYSLIEGNDALAKFAGFWAVMIKAGFSYQGTELVGVAAGETKNPRKNVPAAIRKTFYRILFFFVGSIFFIGLLVPYDNPELLSGSDDASASPFVIAAKLAGVKVIPDLINVVLLFVVISAANSNVYSGSRILVGLVNDGAAPKFLSKTWQNGVPFAAVLFTAAFGLLAYANLASTGSTVFNWLLNISGVAGFITWAAINLCHLQFMKALAAQGISRDSLPYKSWGQPFLSWFGLVFNILIIFTQGFEAFVPWNIVSFFTAYISLMLFVVLYIVHKLVTKSKFVNPKSADVRSGSLETDTTVWPEAVPTTLWQKMWAWLC
ncbi:amino acid permease/ SLC12A domain-containing protein [Calycina marina]|uniref:Amino acid permease/ SLC12A domain-containing protein n=1 Tax=Calycina marina TaxID=1763456 RepID=A0A9P7Z507_9HELO|nr:amino acid permease/ SLC12A domain-containing protein [Calycina marina]